MERRDQPDRTAVEAAEERALREHPAKPEQTDEGFEQGYDQKRDTPEEELGPNFARGISEEPPEAARQGRFSTGEEQTPEDDPEKNIERRFSQGSERNPTSS